jgi:hypothetical protein
MMATLLNTDGSQIDVHPATSHGFGKHEIQALVGTGYGIFLLKEQSVMVANLSAAWVGQLRNARAIRILRTSVFDPLFEIHGVVLLAASYEIDNADVVGPR